TDCTDRNVTGSSTLLADSANFIWQMPTQAEAAAAGQTFPSYTARVKVDVWSTSNNTASDTSDANFYIVQPTTTDVRTLLLWDSGRIGSRYPGQAAALGSKLGELAAHAKVSGVVLDLATVPAIQTAYGAWDAAPTDQSKANAVASAIQSY